MNTVNAQPPSTGICGEFGVCLFHPTASRRPAEAAEGTEMASGASQSQAAGTGDTSVSLGDEGVPHPGLAEPVLCLQGSPRPAVAGSPRGSQDN